MSLRAWLDERTPLASLEEAIAHKTVPQHRYSALYFLGGMTLFLFVISRMSASNASR